MYRLIRDASGQAPAESDSHNITCKCLVWQKAGLGDKFLPQMLHYATLAMTDVSRDQTTMTS